MTDASDTSPSANAGAEAIDGLAIVSGLRGLFVWIASSIAGITALLYAFGYLVIRANLGMLGLYGFVDYGNDVFLQEGAKFFVVIGNQMLRGAVAPLLAFFVAVAVIAFVLQPLVAGTRVAAACRRGGASVKNAISRLSERTAIPINDLLRRILFAAVFFFALNYAGNTLSESVSPLCLSNLLYANPNTVQCPPSLQSESAALQKTILSDDSKALERVFYDLFYRAMGLLALTFVAWRIALPWSGRGWFVSPLVAAAAIFVILLPMDYGVLQRSISYPRIELTIEHGESGSGAFFLMNRTGGEFVLWDQTARQLLWIPAGSVARADIRSVEDLFGPTPTKVSQGNSK